MQVLEFFIEPFTEGRPGPHVTAAITAVEGLGAEVDLGPFSSTCRVADDEAPATVAALVEAAIANGASSVRLSVVREGE